MKIAIFSPSQNPYSETFIQAHKNYLADNVSYYYGLYNAIKLENGTIGFSKRERYIQAFNKHVLNINLGNLQHKAIIKSLRRKEIDVILVEYGNHAHNLLPLLKKAAIPFVVHFHGFDASQKKTIEQCNSYEQVFEECANVIAVSKVMENKLLGLGCPRHKLVYNVYGPRPEFHKVIPAFTKKQFIAIGRFTDKKAPYYTILAFHKVLGTHPEAQLFLAGDGALYATCKNLVKHLGIEDNVQLLGIITGEEYQEYLKTAIAFVQHSITAEDGDMEGTPLAILEASAAGLPVISTVHAGIQDVIIHNKTGLLSKEHDVDAMAAHMKSLLDDIDMAKKMGAEGKRIVFDSFNLKRHIASLQATLKEAMLQR